MDKLNELIDQLIKEKGYGYALGFTQAQMRMMMALLSKKNQKYVEEDFERAVQGVLSQ